jgi:hypothetical protein
MPLSSNDKLKVKKLLDVRKATLARHAKEMATITAKHKKELAIVDAELKKFQVMIGTTGKFDSTFRGGCGSQRYRGCGGQASPDSGCGRSGSGCGR